MKDRDKTRGATRIIEIKAITIALMTLMAILFGGACSSGTGGDANLPIAPQPDLSLHPIYSNYDFGHQDNIIDIGIQPLLIPPGIITEAMKRDALLQKALSEDGMELRFHAFLKGADINYFLQRGDLEVVFAGDMPMLTASASYDTTVTSLVQHGYSSVVARRQMLITELKGKKVAYAFGSNAHFGLMNAITAVGLSGDDVQLIPLDVNEMPEALAAGKIHAFSAWEPTPSIAVAQYDEAVIVHRFITTAYLYFSTSFRDQYPAAVNQLIASEQRAINWLKDHNQNLLEASGWALQAGEQLSGKEMPLSAADYAIIAREDLINSVIGPVILERHIQPDSQLYREFIFLQKLGVITPTVTWEEIQSSFDLSLAKNIMRNGREYQLAVYDYSHQVSVE